MEIATRLTITMSFTPEDLAWIQQSGAAVPPFWSEHLTPPAVGDLVRFAGHQWGVVGRVWEHDGSTPVLRLYMSDRKPQSDARFH